MQRREFLASSLGAILTIGQQEPVPGEWKVYHILGAGDFIAARSLGEAIEFYADSFGMRLAPDDLREHAIERFGCARFCDDAPGAQGYSGGELIAPWIRRQLADGPPLPCYLFTAFDCL